MIRRPKTLTVVMWFAGIYAVGAVIGIAAVVAGIGEPAMGGMPVSRDTWLRVAAPLVATIAVLMGLTSAGLQRQRVWARWPFMCIWPVIALYGLGCGMVGAIPWSLVARAWIDALLFGAVAAWLLFRHRPSAAWFDALSARPNINR
jgi:hypothetical protein